MSCNTTHEVDRMGYTIVSTSSKMEDGSILIEALLKLFGTSKLCMWEPILRRAYCWEGSQVSTAHSPTFVKKPSLSPLGDRTLPALPKVTSLENVPATNVAPFASVTILLLVSGLPPLSKVKFHMKGG
eukprot:5656510-Pyramimonas_sp.AAC.2